MKTIPMLEAPTAALLIALAVGAGLAFHPLFFVVAVIIVLLIAGQWTRNEIRSFLVDFRELQTLGHRGSRS